MRHTPRSCTAHKMVNRRKNKGVAKVGDVMAFSRDNAHYVVQHVQPPSKYNAVYLESLERCCDLDAGANGRKVFRRNGICTHARFSRGKYSKDYMDTGKYSDEECERISAWFVKILPFEGRLQ